MISTVVGGAMLPHAPQFFTMPDTEDKSLVEQVKKVAAEIGKNLKALKPDLWIIFSNDHAEQFFHNAAPPFTVHVGGEATGEFAGRNAGCGVIVVWTRAGPPRRKAASGKPNPTPPATTASRPPAA